MDKLLHLTIGEAEVHRDDRGSELRRGDNAIPVGIHLAYAVDQPVLVSEQLSQKPRFGLPFRALSLSSAKISLEVGRG